MDPDILIAVETKTNGSIYDSEFLPQNYNASRRTLDGGGILVATKDIIAEPLPRFDTKCEIRWVKVHLQAAKTIIGAYYLPPSASIDHLQELDASLNKVREQYPSADILLGGDFNLRWINWENLSYAPSMPDKQACELLLSIALDHNLDQLNHEPTRKNNISCPELVTSCTTGPGISDHDHILLLRANIRA